MKKPDMAEIDSIGDILRVFGHNVDDKVLAAAVQEQNASPTKVLLGEVLVKMGVVTKDDVDKALALQVRLRGPQREAAKAAQELLEGARAGVRRRTQTLQMACLPVTPTHK